MIEKRLVGYRFKTSRGNLDKDLWTAENDEDAKEYAIELKKRWGIKKVEIYRLYEVLEEVK